MIKQLIHKLLRFLQMVADSKPTNEVFQLNQNISNYKIF